MVKYMKIGRNEKCPCGSGLKYKNCCLDKDKATETSLYQGLINMHSYILSNKEHIKKYRKIRKVHSDIINSMINDIDNGKYNLDVSIYLKDAEVLVGRKIKFKKSNYEDLMNYYGIFMFGKDSIAMVYLENNRYKDSTKIKILNSMINAYTGLFEIKDIDMNNGYVYLEDVIKGKKFKIIDQSMSLNKEVIGRVYIYSRIMEIDNIAFNNCAMPIYKDNKEINKYISIVKNNDYNDIVKSIALYNIALNGRKNMSFRTFEVS